MNKNSPIKKCLFPEAGYGTRFLPATKATPKEMLPVLTKPLIQYGVEEAIAAGMDTMAIVTGRGKRAIEDHFDISYELENQIKGTSKEHYLNEIRAVITKCTFSYTRQIEMKGLGHAILCGETLIGDQPFAVVLADDLCDAPNQGVLAQMVELYKKYHCSIVAIEEVPKDETYKYGVIDGNEIDLDQLREQIGFVTQDTQLFSGSIRENLLFVCPTASDAECMEMLEKAACQSLLARADKGLDTVIGEGGVKVSGGEKQRLSIARALLRKPSLLVFDEATSALDSLTEKEISETIRSISDNRQHLTVLIAHRLSTVMHADKIIVLEKGQIVEQGKHNDLLDTKGLYYAMWRQQIGERERASVKVAVV